MRRAAQRVPVLQSGGTRSVGIRAFEIGAYPGAAAHLSGVRLGAEQASIEVLAVAVGHVDQYRGDRRCQPSQSQGLAVSETGERGHDARPVHQRQTLFPAAARVA